jgi:hypothetical protein
MKASEWLKTLPEQPTQEREDKIYQAVLDGNYVLNFTPIEINYGDNLLHMDVAEDALQVGQSDDSVRVAASALTACAIAEHLGCILPTAKICDLIWDEARRKNFTLKPHTQTPDSQMAYTSRFVKHSEAIESERAGRAGLLWTVGKSFVLSNRIFGQNEGKAANYGWHVASSPYPSVSKNSYVLQPLATAHVDTFTDYSQLITGLVKKKCYLNGCESDIRDLLKDNELCKIISSEGPLIDTIYPRTSTHGPSPCNPDKPDQPDYDWRVLKYSMKGSDVREMQEILLNLNYNLNPYGADGDFGSVTRDQVLLFQSKNNLTADGIVGAKTREELIKQNEKI